VEEVLRRPQIQELSNALPEAVITDCVRDTIAGARTDILAGRSSEVDVERIIAATRAQALRLRRPSLRRVINVSGIVIHTNLGRSVLTREAVEAVTQIARAYSTLEYDTDAQARGSRHDHYERLIRALTGAEAALAVNNNAAAVMMVLSEFANGREAVVSRGELIEIGGSFRVPDIMRLSNAEMVEVGTTNKTHLRDYREALTAKTALLLKVHPSNYRMVGFTEAVSTKELRQLADEENERRRSGGGAGTDAGSGGEAGTGSGGSAGTGAGAGAGTGTGSGGGWQGGGGAGERSGGGAGAEQVLVYEDLGSGALIPLDCFGEYAEPTVRNSLNQGCDLVSFSGDKLLGGPQAGIIAGSRQLIDRLKASPWARVLRLDKLTLAALEATLRHYLDVETVCEKIPTLRMLSEPAAKVKARAERLKIALEQKLSRDCARVSVVEAVAQAGGGALPMCDIPSFAVRVEFRRGSARECERYLIAGREVPVIPRLKKEALLCDTRTLAGEDEITEIVSAFEEYFGRLSEPPNQKEQSDGI
jgi:L-seryl-tRNA(Ser) seleniumtransferase